MLYVYVKIKNKIKNLEGVSMIEIIVALGLFATMVASLLVFSLQGLESIQRSIYYQQALLYLDEGTEAVMAIARDDWSNLAFTQSALTIRNAQWYLAGEGSTETLNDFSRTIYFSDIYRDDNHQIVEQSHVPADLDELSKYADIQVERNIVGQLPISLHKRILLSYFASSSLIIK